MAKSDRACLTDALVRPYADFFAYSPGAAGNEAALIEGLLRLETCSAGLDAAIPGWWRDLAGNGLTLAGDAEKQRLDHLFGLDGKAGLLGLLKRYRRMAERDLPTMPAVQLDAFLGALLAFADDLLPNCVGSDLWPTGGAAHVLPLYLQALALIVVVQGWIGGRADATKQAAAARHRAFLTE